MEVSFDIAQFFSEGIQRLDKKNLTKFDHRKHWMVFKSIDLLGQISAKKQGLKRIITSSEKLIDNNDEQTIYIKWKKTSTSTTIFFGFLKIGYKKLYLTDNDSNQFEEKVLCILDFYVAEGEQRKGHGFSIFEKMLKTEHVSLSQCAFDQPSEALQSFLMKHYKLSNLIWQNIKFAVFPNFFAGKTPTKVNKMIHHGRGSRANPFIKKDMTSISENSSSQNESVAELMSYDSTGFERPVIDPNTPTGRKNTRDFGHTKLW